MFREYYKKYHDFKLGQKINRSTVNVRKHNYIYPLEFGNIDSGIVAVKNTQNSNNKSIVFSRKGSINSITENIDYESEQCYYIKTEVCNYDWSAYRACIQGCFLGNMFGCMDYCRNAHLKSCYTDSYSNCWYS